MKHSRGFTLIEVLVVIVVVALLVSISALNSDSDPREDILKTEASRIKFYLELATDEAILNSKNLGLNLTEKQISPYSWVKSTANSDATTNIATPTSDKWAWTDFQSQNLSPIQTNNNIELQLYINEKEITLLTELQDNKPVTPQIIIQSSGIQTLAEIKLSISDYENTISIKSNGAGRFKVGVLSNEI